MVMRPAIDFSPLSPEFQANPYPFYDMLRDNMPIFFWQDWGMWFLTRYEDCSFVLRDPRFGREILKHMTREELGWGEVPDNQKALVEVTHAWMLFRDPPDHTRMRGLVHKAFTPRIIERLRDRIQAITDQLIDDVLAKGSMDVITDFAYPLPITVIAELLGVPSKDMAVFQRWSRALAFSLEFTTDPEIYVAAATAAHEFGEYLRERFAECRIKPQDDLLSALLAAEIDGEKLSEQDLIGTCTLLLTAGHETTINLIGNGLYALLSNRDQWEKFTANPSLTKIATEELLRYDSPVQLTSRRALQDIEYNGVTFKKGQEVATMLGAANRDPAKFTDPNTLDITREPNQHMAFGNGIHFCLGAPLARLEGQIAFETLARRLPNLALAGEPVRRNTYLLRGLSELKVTF